MRKMKDSGIQWIGDIPESWKILKIGMFYIERKQKVNDIDYPPLSVTMKGILPQLSTVAKSDAHDDRKLVCKGDFAINSRSDRRGSCGISDYDGSVSLINIVLQPLSHINPKFYSWLFTSSMFSDEFYKWGHGIVNDLWTTNWQDMKHISIPVPSTEEQKRIADFLDKKCGEIDNIITRTKATIEEYKKLKQSVITQAVTKGIRKNRPMKDSGIDWIGDIPQEWKLVQLKRFTNIGNGKEIKKELDKNDIGAYPVYGSGGIFKYTNEYMYDGICVMFGRKGTIGKPLYVEDRFWIVDTMYFLTYGSKLNAKYNYYQLNSFDWGQHITQTALPSIVASDIVSCKFPIPTIDEQQEIVSYLDEKCSEIDKLIQKKEQLLDELENYKKSLIYEYVTGKRKVN